MTEEMTRAAKKPASTGRKTSSTAKKKTSTTAKKPSSTAKKPASTAKKPSTTAKKPASSAKKPSTASTFRLSAAEKKIITDYRKCNALMKKLIALLAEKGSGNLTRAELEGLTRGSMENLLDDQGDLL